MYRFVFLAYTLLSFTCLPGLAEKIEDLPKPTAYVSDFAGVLSQTSAAQLNRLCWRLDQSAHAQIAVVTINTLDEDDIDDYAARLEEKWGVGRKEDRGVLLLFAIKDRKRRIEVGYGLEGILPDGKVGDIGRQMVPQLQSADYDGAIGLGVTQVATVIAKDAGVQLNAPVANRSNQNVQQVHLSVGQLIMMGIFLLIVLVVLSRVGGGGLLGFLLGMLFGGGGPRGGGGSGGGGGDSDSGFGGFGGGSSGGGGASGNW